MSEIFTTSRLYIDQPFRINAGLALGKPQIHYLRNVMRLERGGSLRVFNGRDGEYLTEISALTKNEGHIILLKKIKEQISRKSEVHLLFAPIKKQRLDFLIEKAVELGVTGLHPVLTHRTEVRSLNEERIKSQIIEAAEQCERLDIPTLHPLESLPAKIEKWKNTHPILWCYERSTATSVFSHKQKDWAFLIGPAGGFDDDEAAFLEKTPQVVPVSLGESLYRAETAALICLVQTLGNT